MILSKRCFTKKDFIVQDLYLHRKYKYDAIWIVLVILWKLFHHMWIRIWCSNKCKSRCMILDAQIRTHKKERKRNHKILRVKITMNCSIEIIRDIDDSRVHLIYRWSKWNILINLLMKNWIWSIIKDNYKSEQNTYNLCINFKLDQWNHEYVVTHWYEVRLAFNSFECLCSQRNQTHFFVD